MEIENNETEDKEPESEEFGSKEIENKLKSRKSFFLILSLVFFFILVIAGTYVFLAEKQETTQNILEKNKIIFLEARNAERNIDFSSSIKKYQELSEKDTDVVGRTWSKIKLGFLHNQSGDFTTGIPILKEIVADESLPNKLRVEALVSMVNIYYRGRWKEPLQIVFDDTGIYREALGNGDLNNLKDLEFALRRLYETADAMYEMSYIKYVLAVSYTSQLLDNNTLSKDEKDSVANIIKGLIAQGDRLALQERQDSTYNSEGRNFAYNLRFPARGFRFFNVIVLALYEGTHFDDVGVMYRQLSELYGNPPSPSLEVLERYHRFYYAAFLAEVYGESKKEDIRSLLLPLTLDTESNALSMWVFLNKALNRDLEERNHNEQFILNLASIDQDFNDFLKSKGWKE